MNRKRQQEKQARFVQVTIVVLLGLALSPGIAEANAGIPMITVLEPMMLYSFIPIFIIEAFYYSRMFKKPLVEMGKASFVANLVTTIVGVPLSWLLMLGFAYAFGYLLYFSGFDFDVIERSQALKNIMEVLASVIWSAWVIRPIEHMNIPNYLGIVVPSSIVILLIPAFYVSSYMEGFVIRKSPMMRDVPRETINKHVHYANAITYLLLEVVAFVWLINLVRVDRLFGFLTDYLVEWVLGSI